MRKEQEMGKKDDSVRALLPRRIGRHDARTGSSKRPRFALIQMAGAREAARFLGKKIADLNLGHLLIRHIR